MIKVEKENQIEMGYYFYLVFFFYFALKMSGLNSSGSIDPVKLTL